MKLRRNTKTLLSAASFAAACGLFAAPALPATGFGEAIAALIQLGYRETEARAAIERLPADARAAKPATDLVREALKQLA